MSDPGELPDPAPRDAVRDAWRRMTRVNPYAPNPAVAGDRTFGEAVEEAMAARWATFYSALLRRGVPEVRAAEWTARRIEIVQYQAGAHHDE